MSIALAKSMANDYPEQALVYATIALAEAQEETAKQLKVANLLTSATLAMTNSSVVDANEHLAAINSALESL